MKKVVIIPLALFLFTVTTLMAQVRLNIRMYPIQAIELRDTTTITANRLGTFGAGFTVRKEVVRKLEDDIAVRNNKAGMNLPDIQTAGVLLYTIEAR